MRLCPCAHCNCAQVEFYFSDANLPTDKKLLKQVKKDPSGYGEACTRATMHGSTTNPAACFTVTCCTWLTCPRLGCCCALTVPVKLFANFRKIRILTKDPDIIAMALQESKVN